MSKKDEHSIGELFSIDSIIYRVGRGDSCLGCSLYYYDENLCLDFHHRFESCSGNNRRDGQDVIFVQLCFT